jgi:hypothetical protein
MQEFHLPVLDASLPPGEAFPRMWEASRSGVAIQVGDNLRLLGYDTLVKACDKGIPQLSDIQEFESVAMLAERVQSQAWDQGLGADNDRFRMITVGKMVHLVSQSERYAGPYLTKPPGTRCTNPSTPHYHPPFHARPGRFCGVCQFALS